MKLPLEKFLHHLGIKSTELLANSFSLFKILGSSCKTLIFNELMPYKIQVIEVVMLTIEAIRSSTRMIDEFNLL